MSKPLSEPNEKKIIKIIKSWTGKLGWKELLAEVEHRLGLKYTRATLSNRENHPKIAAAYADQKKRLKNPTVSAASTLEDEQLQLLSRREVLKKDIAALTEEYLLALANINDRHVIKRREFFFGEGS